MTRKKIIPVLAVLFAATAALLSFHLLALHLDGAPRPAWFDVGCGEHSALSSNCAAVLASPYSYWPPKMANEPEGTPHVPVALLGLFYYVTLTVWLIGIGRVSFERRFWHLIPVCLTGIGLLGSANFVAIMFTKIDEWCFWCLVTHGLNVLIAICLLIMWPRRSAQSAETTSIEAPLSESKKPAHSVSCAPHPSGRLVVTTLLSVCLALFGLMQFYGRAARTKQAMALKTGYDQCVAAIKNMTANSGSMLGAWLNGEKQQIAVRSDDPALWPNSSARDPLEAVVFADFECPSCKRLARFLEKDVEPLFDGRLRLVFKHYPLNHECNPATMTQMHKHACDGARMAEAARVLVGTEGFWKAHDYLFARQDQLKRGTVSVTDMATLFGLDPNRFAEVMNSSAVRERIAEDASTGKRSGVHSTPALFVSGKRVRVPVRGDIHFWDKLADRYWLGLHETRPSSTKLAK